ncbi:MAG: hypothetical protein K8R41_00425 [Bacteroidales bacterium]|nr:hypothetical protein [Bacteroidales bacterium]
MKHLILLLILISLFSTLLYSQKYNEMDLFGDYFFISEDSSHNDWYLQLCKNNLFYLNRSFRVIEFSESLHQISEFDTKGVYKINGDTLNLFSFNSDTLYSFKIVDTLNLSMISAFSFDHFIKSYGHRISRFFSDHVYGDHIENMAHSRWFIKEIIQKGDTLYKCFIVYENGKCYILADTIIYRRNLFKR